MKSFPGGGLFLLDVHVPEQAHIKGTNAFVDFRKIKENQEKPPRDKNTEIVAYCLGGPMSVTAAEDLLDLGYTRVQYLERGTWVWKRAGFQVDPGLLGTF